jgi:diguanylate cyclase (GGDEF)-like protein
MSIKCTINKLYEFNSRIVGNSSTGKGGISLVIHKIFISTILILFVAIHLMLSVNYIKSLTAKDATTAAALLVHGEMQRTMSLILKQKSYAHAIRQSDAYLEKVVDRFKTQTDSDAFIQMHWIDTQWKIFKTLLDKYDDTPAEINQQKMETHCDRYWKTLSQIINNQVIRQSFSQMIATHALVTIIFIPLIFFFIRRYVSSNSDIVKNYDPLTQIYNSRMFYRLVAQEIAKTERYDRSLALVVFDVDFFRRINDFFGHKVGDDALEQLASLVDQNIRKSDLFCRVGGEEFAVIASDTDLQQAIVLSEKVRKLISGHTFKTVGRITVSLGVVQAKKNDTPETMYKRANERLQVAKKKGRNRTIAKDHSE